MPGCPRARLPGAGQTRTIAVEYTGLKRLLKTAIKVSFSLRTGAGGWSISPTFAYYPTVNEFREPAFQLIALLRDCLYNAEEPPPFFEEFTKIVLAEVFSLLETGKISPRAVDSKNRTLLHYLAVLINDICLDSWTFGGHDSLKWISSESPLLAAAQQMVEDYGVPGTEYDIDGS